MNEKCGAAPNSTLHRIVMDSFGNAGGKRFLPACFDLVCYWGNALL